MTTENQPLAYYVKEYGRYIFPTWLFPVYFIAWGLACELLKPKHVLLWFFLTVVHPFFGTFLWSMRARKHIPDWRFDFLTMTVPFFIFTAIALLLAVGQFAFGTANPK